MLTGKCWFEALPGIEFIGLLCIDVALQQHLTALDGSWDFAMGRNGSLLVLGQGTPRNALSLVIRISDRKTHPF